MTPTTTEAGVQPASPITTSMIPRQSSAPLVASATTRRALGKDVSQPIEQGVAETQGARR